MISSKIHISVCNLNCNKSFIVDYFACMAVAYTSNHVTIHFPYRLLDSSIQVTVKSTSSRPNSSPLLVAKFLTLRLTLRGVFLKDGSWHSSQDVQRYRLSRPYFNNLVLMEI